MLKRFFDVTFFSICVNLILPVTVLSVQFLHICISLQNTCVTIVGRVNSWELLIGDRKSFQYAM